MTVVLDASALLAYLLDEPGAIAVEEAMVDGDAFLSTVNEAEVLTRLDRACLALGRPLHLPVLTADRAWGHLDSGTTGLDIRLIH